MLAELVELAPSGVEQVDGDGFVEFAIYGVPGELPELPMGDALVGDVEVSVSGRGGAGRLGRALEALPRAGAGGRAGSTCARRGRSRRCGRG